MTQSYSVLSSPIGDLTLVAEGDVLREIRFEKEGRDF